MVSAVRKVQIKCYGVSAEGAIPGLVDHGGLHESVVSVWALQETEENMPDENSRTKGTETGKPGTPPRNDSHSARTSSGCEGRTGLTGWFVSHFFCNVLFCA